MENEILDSSTVVEETRRVGRDGISRAVEDFEGNIVVEIRNDGADQDLAEGKTYRTVMVNKKEGLDSENRIFSAEFTVDSGDGVYNAVFDSADIDTLGAKKVSYFVEEWNADTETWERVVFSHEKKGCLKEIESRNYKLGSREHHDALDGGFDNNALKDFRGQGQLFKLNQGEWVDSGTDGDPGYDISDHMSDWGTDSNGDIWVTHQPGTKTFGGNQFVDGNKYDFVLVSSARKTEVLNGDRIIPTNTVEYGMLVSKKFVYCEGDQVFAEFKQGVIDQLITEAGDQLAILVRDAKTGQVVSAQDLKGLDAGEGFVGDIPETEGSTINTVMENTKAENRDLSGWQKRWDIDMEVTGNDFRRQVEFRGGDFVEVLESGDDCVVALKVGADELSADDGDRHTFIENRKYGLIAYEKKDGWSPTTGDSMVNGYKYAVGDEKFINPGDVVNANDTSDNFIFFDFDKNSLVHKFGEGVEVGYALYDFDANGGKGQFVKPNVALREGSAEIDSLVTECKVCETPVEPPVEDPLTGFELDTTNQFTMRKEINPLSTDDTMWVNLYGRPWGFDSIEASDVLTGSQLQTVTLVAGESGIFGDNSIVGDEGKYTVGKLTNDVFSYDFSGEFKYSYAGGGYGPLSGDLDGALVDTTTGDVLALIEDVVTV